MMANLPANHRIINISRRFFANSNCQVFPSSIVKHRIRRWPISRISCSGAGTALVQHRPPSPPSTDEGTELMIDDHDHDHDNQMADVGIITNDDDDDGDSGEMDVYLVREYGWKVRRMVEDKTEIRKVAQIQAQAFHVPALFFDDFFFQFFLAEVLSGLLYRLRNSPPDRYACLVAEEDEIDDSTKTKQAQEAHQKLVGVVDVTALRDYDVLQHLKGANEYLYVSGIAVSRKHRRQKVATTLLKACEVISVRWGYEYLVLRAYEDDWGARTLYSNAGYGLVSIDPPWVAFIGRKRRILMIKRLP